MGNEQSSELSPEAREAWECERQARRDASVEYMTRKREEAKAKFLEELLAESPTVHKKLPKRPAPTDSATEEQNGHAPAVLPQTHAGKKIKTISDPIAAAEGASKRDAPRYRGLFEFLSLKSRIGIDDPSGCPVDGSTSLGEDLCESDYGDRHGRCNSPKKHIAQETAANLVSSTPRNGPTSAPRKSKPGARAREVPPPVYKAYVKVLADGGTMNITGSTADIDDGIMSRIKKCLDRASHPNTPESEAKRALHMTSRLMAQYNVSKAEVLAHETPEEQRKHADESVVTVQRTDGDRSKHVRHQGFVDELVVAMETFFDCKMYTTAFTSGEGCKTHFNVTFYGIAENTAAAAKAFEMTYNLITEWARVHKGKNSYCLGAADGLRGMAIKAKETEEEEAKAREKEALASRVRQEEAERDAQLERLAPRSETTTGSKAKQPTVCIDLSGDDEDMTSRTKGSIDDPILLDFNGNSTLGERIYNDIDSTHVSDADDDNDENVFQPDFEVEDEPDVDPKALIDGVDGFLEYENDGQQGIDWTALPTRLASNLQNDSIPAVEVERPEQRHAAEALEDTTGGPTNVEQEPEVQWATHMQLIAFRDSANDIAEAYLKKKGIKLGAGKERSKVVRDRDAYEQGVEDGKKIDVHRRRIKE